MPLLYTLTTRHHACWILDLTGPAHGPAELTAPSVYALVVPVPPASIYVGATKNLRSRIRQHLSRSRSERAPRSPAAAALSRVVAGRAGLLVIRLEAVAPGNETLLRRLELAWLLVAAREELPVRRHRGPRLQWSGEPGELRAAFRLARKRAWPGQWIRILRPLCENRTRLDRAPIRRTSRPDDKRRRPPRKAKEATDVPEPGQAP